jgi:hypothetical protein
MIAWGNKDMLLNFVDTARNRKLARPEVELNVAISPYGDRRERASFHLAQVSSDQDHGVPERGGEADREAFIALLFRHLSLLMLRLS